MCDVAGLNKILSGNPAGRVVSEGVLEHWGEETQDSRPATQRHGRAGSRRRLLGVEGAGQDRQGVAPGCAMQEPRGRDDNLRRRQIPAGRSLRWPVVLPLPVPGQRRGYVLVQMGRGDRVRGES